ncbi:hypothetical protein FGO68_gene7981 [Halteria grandinella]|uniref:Uncharacterized protein n=1 Tax=Halteria grandinella TaxID=5974 RepID=A0A8J8NMP0_HALGN|nr:hypothetical protein FGO68_gene7981 [Halteria grandinella]
MNSKRSTITLTYGDQAENHKGMEMLGTMVDEGQGFQVEELKQIHAKLIEKGFKAELHALNTKPEHPAAALLVVKDFADRVLKPLGKNKEDLFLEQARLEVDKQAFMYGRVVNKNARWNLCFDDTAQEPDYQNGKGRIYSFSSVPLTTAVTDTFIDYFGPKAAALKGEGNYYYDVNECGIGFHGDSERRKVVAIRLGASLPIHYQWFYRGSPVGERMIFKLDGGDVYVMSEKTVGTDWKKKVVYTLRHATGCSKFTTIAVKKEGGEKKGKASAKAVSKGKVIERRIFQADSSDSSSEEEAPTEKRGAVSIDELTKKGSQKD